MIDMGERSKIAWTDDTFNPWIGCEPVSAGCANCYAATQVKRWGGDFSKRQRTSAENWRLPLRWNKKPWVCKTCGNAIHKATDDMAAVICECGSNVWHRRRVFCGSLCDWLDDKVPVEWLADLLDTIGICQDLTWMLLTKRPENFTRRLKLAGDTCKTNIVELILRGYFKNVWIGATVENQEVAWERIPALVNIPAAKRFLSIEPLLGPVDLELQHGCRSCNHPGNIVVAYNEQGQCSQCNGTRQEPSGIDWVITGGESGPKARTCSVEWIRSIVGQCKSAGVSCFVKQLGSRFRYQLGNDTAHDSKGADPSEWPEDLRVQQWPT